MFSHYAYDSIETYTPAIASLIQSGYSFAFKDIKLDSTRKLEIQF